MDHHDNADSQNQARHEDILDIDPAPDLRLTEFFLIVYAIEKFEGGKMKKTILCMMAGLLGACDGSQSDD
ncbi:MAG: hypothetical protein COB49_08865, partial [Alphaproteobacteria bacterium]